MTLEFSALNFNVREDESPAEVIIVRTGDNTEEASVTLELSDGTAIAPDDYDNTSIAVTFAPGETQVTVEIPIVDDSEVEGTETVNLLLTDPEGDNVGAQNDAILRIIDNDDASDGSIVGFAWSDFNGNGVRDTRLVPVEEPDVVFVIDVSGSTLTELGEAVVGDINGDEIPNTILDLQLAGFIALNQNLIDEGFGNNADVSIVVFGEQGVQANMNPDPSDPDEFQLSTTPTSDSDGDGVRDVEQILTSITVGFVGAGAATNYEDGLQKTIDTFEALGTASGDGNVIFLSDGQPNTPSFVYRDEVSLLKNERVNLRAFGAGEGAVLDFLQEIDPDAQVFTNPDELLEIFGELEVFKTVFTEPARSGVVVYLDQNNNGTFEIGEEPATVTPVDNPGTPDEDETGNYQFTDLPGNNYVVRGLAPRGSTFTSPVNGFLDVVLPAGEAIAGINFGVLRGRAALPPGSPRARRDSAASLQNSSVAIDVLANDINPEGDIIQLASFTTPNNGTVRRLDNGTPNDQTDDRLIYTPNSGFAGNDSFSYTISDPDGNTDSTIVQLRVIS